MHAAELHDLIPSLSTLIPAALAFGALAAARIKRAAAKRATAPKKPTPRRDTAAFIPPMDSLPPELAAVASKIRALLEKAGVRVTDSTSEALAGLNPDPDDPATHDRVCDCGDVENHRLGAPVALAKWGELPKVAAYPLPDGWTTAQPSTIAAIVPDEMRESVTNASVSGVPKDPANPSRVPPLHAFAAATGPAERRHGPPPKPGRILSCADASALIAAVASAEPRARIAWVGESSDPLGSVNLLAVLVPRDSYLARPCPVMLSGKEAVA